MENEDQISELAQDYESLKSKLKKSQRKLNLIKIAFVIVIILLLLSCIGYSGLSVIYREKFKESQAIETQFDALKARIKSLEDEIEESRFYFYYRYNRKQRYGVDDLESYLDRWQWVEGTYEQGKFDCSEMSAKTERELENEGYHTIMVVGNSPFNQTGRHVWLLVETSEGKYMPVEATRHALVKWDNPYFDLYFEYDHEFETIFDALEYDYDDFNWWES